MMSDAHLNQSASTSSQLFKFGPESFQKAGNSTLDMTQLVYSHYSLMIMQGYYNAYHMCVFVYKGGFPDMQYMF